MELVIFLSLLTLGFCSGTILEKRHFRAISKREKTLAQLPAVTFKRIPPDVSPNHTQLVTGSVVISIDYFKRIFAILRFLFGGTVSAYESLLDRARREAILRLKENAGNAAIILNLRIETSVIGSNAQKKKALGAVEAIAYGTAVYP